MPIFEYHCQGCGADFERLVFPSEKDPVTCPHCNEKKVKKKVSRASIGGSNKNPSCAPGPSQGFS